MTCARGGWASNQWEGTRLPALCWPCLLCTGRPSCRGASAALWGATAEALERAWLFLPHPTRARPCPRRLPSPQPPRLHLRCGFPLQLEPFLLCVRGARFQGISFAPRVIMDLCPVTASGAASFSALKLLLGLAAEVHRFLFCFFSNTNQLLAGAARGVTGERERARGLEGAGLGPSTPLLRCPGSWAQAESVCEERAAL